MPIEVNLTDDQLRDVVIAAIASSITVEKRDALIRKSIEAAFERKPRQHGYGYNPSEIELMFRNAVLEHAREVVREQLGEDQKLGGRLREIVHASLDLLLDTKADQIANQLAERVAEALARGMADRY